jgi:hypothetical protein
LLKSPKEKLQLRGNTRPMHPIQQSRVPPSRVWVWPQGFIKFTCWKWTMLMSAESVRELYERAHLGQFKYMLLVLFVSLSCLRRVSE